MKLGVIIAALIGVAIAIAVVAWYGFGSVLTAVAAIGWRGFGFLVVYTFLPFLLLGSAWFALADKSPIRQWGAFVWARMVRDAGAELLPFSVVSGFALGARAAILQGLAPTLVFSTEVVDVTTELIAQLGFTALGLVVLGVRLGTGSAHDGLLEAGAAGLALTTAGAVVFIVMQRRGMGLVERLARRFLPGAEAGAADFGSALKDIYRRPGRLALGVAIHMAAWIASAAGSWIALRLAGAHITLASVIAIESLVAAMRSAIVIAPAGVGVQEATYALLGPIFGLGAEMSLALSLVKRARDVAIGVPTLLIWQGFEGRRLVVGGGRRDVGVAGGVD